MTTPDERPRASNGHFAVNLTTADRDAQAADLRRQGKTYQQIADELGMSNRGTAHHAVMRVLAEVRKDAGEKLVAVEREELERLYLLALEIAETEHRAVAQGKAVSTDDGEAVYDAAPKIQAINAARQIRESYRKLLGLDQPAKQEISGGVKYEVVGVDPADLS